MSAARIGKIRMKAGGAEVRLIRQETPNPNCENYRGGVVAGARKIAEMSEPGSELVGYVVIGLYEDGKSSVGWRYDGNTTVLPRLLLPNYIAELIRRELITAPEADEIACAVVNRANGFDPTP